MNIIKPKLIIDTDPGHDDALAILMVILSKIFEVLAVTTVAGNATIKKVTRNAQALLNLIESNVPVYSGLPQPMKRKLVTAVVHGESGLEGFDTSKTDFCLTSDAPEKLIELVCAQPNEVSILAVGPLSNVARAIQSDPSFSTKVKQLVIMGGAINVPGNKNRVAEFNFFVDPEAADIVLRSSIPKTLIPLDVCEQTLLNVSDFFWIKNKKLRSILVPMMKHFAAGLALDDGIQGVAVYDALAAYFLVNPSACLSQTMDVLIETRGRHTAGMCVVEKRLHKTRKTNVSVVTKIDGDQFRKDLFRILDEN